MSCFMFILFYIRPYTHVCTLFYMYMLRVILYSAYICVVLRIHYVILVRIFMCVHYIIHVMQVEIVTSC